MDSVIVLVALSILGLCGLIYGVLKSAASSSARHKSSDQKRAEIIESYKLRMDEALKPYLADPEALQSKKAQLLRELSVELSRNIFFDADETRDVIGELAHYTVEK